jgi:glycerophosphoryl diester phosphodiesterase
MFRHQLIGVLLAAALMTANRPAAGQLIVAHRGASYDAPENTLAAFQLAWQKGADAIEGDFLLSSDGQVVCIHDDTTSRTGRVEWNVADTPLADLRKLDVGSWKHERWSAQRIPTLSEVLATIPRGKRIMIEVKCGPQIVEPLRRALTKAALDPEQTIVIAFDEEVIARTKQQIPQVPAFWLTSYQQDKTTGKWTPAVEEIIDTLRRVRADGLGSQAKREVVDGAFVEAIRAAGFQLNVWTVNDAADARYFQQVGVQSITTDRPTVIRRGLSGE